jgi:hypothetical protein
VSLPCHHIKGKGRIIQNVSVKRLNIVPDVALTLGCHLQELVDGLLAGRAPLGIRPQQILEGIVTDGLCPLDVFQAGLRIDGQVTILHDPENRVVKRLLLAIDAVGMVVDCQLAFRRKVVGNLGLDLLLGCCQSHGIGLQIGNGRRAHPQGGFRSLDHLSPGFRLLVHPLVVGTSHLLLQAGQVFLYA